MRTMFAALHHFRPEQARLVLSDAVLKGAAIAVFEPLERTVRMVALLGVMSFLRGFTHTPRIGRVTPSRFFFTYVLPLAPLVFAWDGMVSALRTYTPDELGSLAASTSEGMNYRWETGRFETSGPGRTNADHLPNWLSLQLRIVQDPRKEKGAAGLARRPLLHTVGSERSFKPGQTYAARGRRAPQGQYPSATETPAPGPQTTR